jgi:ATP-dependent helicase/nuclease subunit B
MAVQFILGRSGTGKTSYCIRSVVDALLEPDASGPLILLVPEQASYQAERSILSDRRIAGYNRLHVLSFDRLQFMLLGKNTARPGISRIGRQMVVHRILRENQDKLQVFGPSASLPGLAKRMAETIAELHQYAKSPDDIERLLESLRKDQRNSLAVLKFADIGLILAEYVNFIEDRFLDPDVQLSCACRAVAESPLVSGALLWVDGFAGFTDGEAAILLELLKAASQARIALCLDPTGIDLSNPDKERIDPAGLFSTTQRTYASLVEGIRRAGLPFGEPIILKEPLRFSGCRQLAHVERNIFQFKPPTAAAGGKVRTISAPNERREVRFVARQVLRLVREQNYRYRDIAVIASDIECYQHYIRAYFDDYGIPFFIDKRRPLSRHPVVQLICSGLRVITGGFSTGEVLAYLKTDLLGLERSDIDLLENYCVAFGVEGKDWQSRSPWGFAGADNEDFDDGRIDEIRNRAVMALLKLESCLRADDAAGQTLEPGEFTRAVFGFLDDLGVRKTLGGWIEEARMQKDSAAVDEHRQLYERLVDVFDELVEVFAGRPMTVEDYLAIIGSAFSQLTLALIPPTLDQVLVGSIERSRHPELKAVFLIGATQRQFPVPFFTESVLGDEDRAAAALADFALAPTASERLVERQYLAYIAFTRPSEFLCVTYPSIDEKGCGVPRSQFVTELESLFEDLTEECIAGGQCDIETVASQTELADLLCSRLGSDAGASEAADERLAGLLAEVCSDVELGRLGSRVLAAIEYDNAAELDGQVVKELSGRYIKGSATRLGTFAACPYQYFARYVLKLEPRKEFKFEPLDLGTFYHRVLDALLKQLIREKKNLADVEDTQLLEVLRGQISRLITEDPFISNFIEHSRHNSFIIDSAAEVLEGCVVAIGRMARAGDFRPTGSEVSFGQDGDADETLGQYELALSGGGLLSLGGKIDRLDVSGKGGGGAAVVFDYKRRAKSFSWSRLYHGLDMQLPIYILAVRNCTESKARNAVGAFYIPVEVPPASATLDKLTATEDRFGHKAKGIFDGAFADRLDRNASGDSRFYSFYAGKDGKPFGNYGTRCALRSADFEKVLEFTESKIIHLAEGILSGRIDVKPYRLNRDSPCSYCDYKSLCRFDWQINEYNPLAPLNKLEVLEKTGASDD